MAETKFENAYIITKYSVSIQNVFYGYIKVTVSAWAHHQITAGITSRYYCSGGECCQSCQSTSAHWSDFTSVQCSFVSGKNTRE